MKALSKLLGIAASALTLIGCGGNQPPVETNIGRVDAVNKAQTAPGDDDAIRKLSDQIKANPDATKFVVKWENGFPSGYSSPHVIEYDKSTKILTDTMKSGSTYKFTNVSDEQIHTLAEKSKTSALDGTVDNLKKLGATMEFVK